MTDFEYDVYQRKQLAKQAKYRKNGSRSRKCTLPQDRMTMRQWKDMNGEMVSLRMDRPYRDWKAFKALSLRTRREYIQNLRDKYNVSIGDVARMFGVAYNTAKFYFTDESRDFGVDFPKGTKMSTEEKKEWKRFLASDAETLTEEQMQELYDLEVDDMTPAFTANYVPRNPPTNAMKMDKFSLSFTGELNVEGIANSLRMILGENRIGNIEVRFQLIDVLDNVQPRDYTPNVSETHPRYDEIVPEASPGTDGTEAE